MCIEKRPMTVKRPTVKMTILTDFTRENAYGSFKRPMKLEKGRWYLKGR